MAIKCDSCPDCVPDNEVGMDYCKKIGHYLENGYAKIQHSSNCKVA